MESGILVAFIIVFLIGLGIGFAWGKKTRKEEREDNLRFQQSPSQFVSPPPRRKSPIEEFGDRLNELLRTNDLKTAFFSAFNEVSNKFSDGDRLNFAEALEETAKNSKYNPSDLVTIMAEENYSLGKIANFLNDNTNLEVKEFTEALVPFAKGDTPKLKAAELLSAIENIFDLNDEGENLIPSLITLGCSPNEIAESLYENTSMDLLDVIKAMKWENSPLDIIALAKKLKTDLTDSDEYKSLRDTEGIDFKTAAKILKECGSTALDILNTEEEYDTIPDDDTDEMKNVIEILSAAEFSRSEILDAIWESNFMQNKNGGEIVDSLYDAGVPMNEINELLIAKNYDLDDLDQELRDNTGMELKTRIELMHMFLNTDKKNPVEEKKDGEKS
ncbi:MAG: hypothetical protein AB1333_02825 [Patescibacteria group bacterium]